MKILCTLLIALLCALGLSACGNNGTDTPDTQQNQTEPDTTAPDTTAPDTNTNVPPEGNVNSQGPDGPAGDGTVTGDLKNAADDVGNAVGGAMDDMGDAAKNAGKAVSDKENP